MRAWKESVIRFIGVVVMAVTFAAVPLETLAAPELMPDGGLFDAEYYASQNPDVVAALGNDPTVLYNHYLAAGKAEGRRPCDPVYGTSPAVIAAQYLSVKQYYSRSVFIGDSIMTGYQYYQARHSGGAMSGITFLAAKSYSAYHAVKPEDPLHPVYLGASRPVWDSIALMDVDRVFIMFGTNDLVVHDPTTTVTQIAQVIGMIKTVNPKVEIHVIAMTPMYAGATLRGMLNNQSIAGMNSLLAQTAQAQGWGIVNIYSPLLIADGSLNPIYSSDHYVHLTNAAYRDVWDTVFYTYALQQLRGK